MRWSRFRFLLIPACAAPLALIITRLRPGAHAPPPAMEARMERGTCGDALTRGHLDESLALGRSFLLHSQRPEGNFTYEYDWKTGAVADADGSVRQAGAAWGLALIHQDQPAPELAAAIERALAFFEKSSRLTDDGRRYIVYPNEAVGSLGAVALVALAHIDYLRVVPARPELQAHLGQYLAMLRSAQTADGRFPGKYALQDGSPAGKPSAHYEGEALLALVKAARYLGREDLRSAAILAADEGHARNVVAAREKEADSDTTKGYFQWSAMSYHELATSGWPDTAKYGDYALELADWMIDVHRIITRARNSGYAYEGLLSAYHLAVLRRDEAHTAKLACAIGEGLFKLTRWQVGHSLANPFVAAAPAGDLRARGGIQNRADDAPLRVDVTQHQMHAVILARRYLRPR